MKYDFRWLAGFIAPAIIVCILCLSIFAIFQYWPNDTNSVSSRYLFSIIKFSIYQAVLSAVISLLLGFFIARMLVRRIFIGRAVIIAALNASFTMPSMIVILVVVLYYGKNGFLSDILNYKLYGLTGILIAHVFLNAPYCARIFLNLMANQNTSILKQSRLLNFTDWQCFRFLDWPIIKPAVLPLTGFIFLICFNSFAVVLTLGGGPKSTSLEVAVYQALRYEFDIPTAAIYASVQLAIGFLVALSLFRFQNIKLLSNNISRTIRPDADKISANLTDGIISFVMLVFWLIPLMWLLKKIDVDALISVVTHSGFYQATLWSFVLATISTLLVFFLIIGLLIRPLQNKNGNDIIAMSLFFFPAIVIATGLFILLIDYSLNHWVMLGLIVIMNALVTLPFAYKVIRQPAYQTFWRYKKLMYSLDLNLWQTLNIVMIPLLKKPLLLALSFSWVLALGDLGIVVLFGTQDLNTLPLLIYRRLGAFQLQEGAVTAIFLLLITMIIYYVQERWHAESK